MAQEINLANAGGKQQVEMEATPKTSSFPDIEKAMNWLKFCAPETASVTTIPFWVTPSEDYSLEEFLQIAPGYSTTAEVMVSDVGEGKYVVLFFEVPNFVTPQPSEESTLVYRYDGLQSFSSIQRYGFYQVPGRLCFLNSLSKAWEGDGSSIPTALRLPNNWLLQSHGQLALDIIESQIGRTLTPEILSLIASVPEEEDGFSSLAYEILSLGNSSGLLVHIPPDYIDKDNTLKAVHAARQLDPAIKTIVESMF